MKKISRCIGLVLLSLSLASCISFRIVPSFPVEVYVESLVLCGDVDQSGELLKPINIQTEFSTEDENIICFVELKNIDRIIRMRWEWYSPDNVLSRDSGNILINQEGRALETLTAYDELQFNIRDQEKKKGRWTVIVLLDDQLIVRRMFTVR